MTHADRLLKTPATFRRLTGLTPAAFLRIAGEVADAQDAARVRRADGPAAAVSPGPAASPPCRSGTNS